MPRLWIAVGVMLLLVGGHAPLHAQTTPTWYFAFNPSTATVYAFTLDDERTSYTLPELDTDAKLWRLGPSTALLGYRGADTLTRFALLNPTAADLIPNLAIAENNPADLVLMGSAGSVVLLISSTTALVFDSLTGTPVGLDDIAPAYVGEPPLTRLSPDGHLRYITTNGDLVQVNVADGSRTVLVALGAVPTYAAANRNGDYWLVTGVGDDFSVAQHLFGPDGTAITLPSPDALFDFRGDTLIGYYLDEPVLYVGLPDAPLTAYPTHQPIYNLTRAFGADGRLVLLNANQLWHFGNGQTQDLGLLSFALYSIEVAPDLRWAVSAGTDAQRYQVWDLQAGAVVADEALPSVGAIYAVYGAEGVVIADWTFSELSRLYTPTVTHDLPTGWEPREVLTANVVLLVGDSGWVLYDVTTDSLQALFDDTGIRLFLN